MNEISKYFILLIANATKFVLAVPLGIAAYDLDYFESVIISSSGGIIGVFVFGYLSKFLIICWSYFLGGTKLEKAILAFFKIICFQRKKKKKKIFSWKNKLIVKVKIYYGIIGIAFLTPCLLSIPIGTFIAVRFYPKLLITFTWLIISVIFWAFVFTSIFIWIS
ncbi:MAG: hypothetical protein HY738_18505 [Bacteroidia bacterium]|nr:hypothetical protein [Bacteroidia bacterium]